MKSIFVALVGIFSFVYLINPTAGFIEFLPDNLPFIGNLDEATATAFLLSALGYFGIDVSRIFGHVASKSKQENSAIKEAEFEEEK